MKYFNPRTKQSSTFSVFFWQKQRQTKARNALGNEMVTEKKLASILPLYSLFLKLLMWFRIFFLNLMDSRTDFFLFLANLSDWVMVYIRIELISLVSLVGTYFHCVLLYSDARVMWDQKTGRSRGFGFVSFRNQQVIFHIWYVLTVWAFSLMYGKLIHHLYLYLSLQEAQSAINDLTGMSD